jgi:hypothetical protein
MGRQHYCAGFPRLCPQGQVDTPLFGSLVNFVSDDSADSSTTDGANGAAACQYGAGDATDGGASHCIFVMTRHAAASTEAEHYRECERAYCNRS